MASTALAAANPSHLRVVGLSQKGVLSDSGAGNPRVPTVDNVTTRVSAEPTSCRLGEEVRLTLPFSEQADRHVLIHDIYLQFSLVYAANARDILCRQGSALIRELRLLADGVEILRIDSQWECALLNRLFLEQFYDPSLRALGDVPPAASAATGSIVQTGFELLGAQDQATYAVKNVSWTGVSGSLYRHKFQLSLNRLTNGLFVAFDARRLRQLQLVVQFVADSAPGIGNALAFDTNAGTYSSVSVQDISAVVQKAYHFARPPSLFLPVTQCLKALMYRYDPVQIPIDLTVAGKLSVSLNINALFPPRTHITRILWHFAPIAPADTADISWMFEAPAAARPHQFWQVEVQYRSAAVSRLETLLEVQEHRTNYFKKRYHQHDECAAERHPAAVANPDSILFYSFDDSNKQVDPGHDLIHGIDSSSNGLQNEYTVILSTSPYRPALSGGPTALWVWAESQQFVEIGPGSSLGGPAPRIRSY